MLNFSIFLLLKSKKSMVSLFVVLLVLWAFNIQQIIIEGLFFFYAGFLLSKQKNWISIIDNHNFLVLFSFPVFSVLDALTESEKYNLLIHKVTILTGCVFLIHSTCYLIKIKKMKSLLTWLSGASFFVYASHEPIMTITRKIMYKLSRPETSMAVTSIYFLSIIATILMCLIFYAASRKILPTFTGFITGGRA